MKSSPSIAGYSGAIGMLPQNSQSVMKIRSGDKLKYDTAVHWIA